MSRQRINPFDQGTPERVLFDRFRKAATEAVDLEKQASIIMTEAKARRAAADRYAEALRSLGCGDKLPALPALPDYSKLGRAE